MPGNLSKRLILGFKGASGPFFRPSPNRMNSLGFRLGEILLLQGIP
jgi:hypothetical protein